MPRCEVLSFTGRREGLSTGSTKYLASSRIIFGMKARLYKCHESTFSLIKLIMLIEPEKFLYMKNHSVKFI